MPKLGKSNKHRTTQVDFGKKNRDDEETTWKFTPKNVLSVSGPLCGALIALGIVLQYFGKRDGAIFNVGSALLYIGLAIAGFVIIVGGLIYLVVLEDRHKQRDKTSERNDSKY